MTETKICPYCGEEILAGAKKCKHCGEWLEARSQLVPHRCSDDVSLEIRFKTQDLKWWQKLLQMYWFNPKSWLLDELVMKKDIVEVKLKNGDRFSCPYTGLKVRFQEDKYGRKEIFLSNTERTIHFKEIPYMLSDDEWEELFAKLESVDDMRETSLNKVSRIIRKIIEAGEGLIP